MPLISSPCTARPMWAPKPRTPGMARKSRLARSVMRTISWWPVLGRVTQSARKSRSLNVGKSDSPMNGTTARPATSVAAVATITTAGRADHAPKRRGVAALEHAHERRLLLLERRPGQQEQGERGRDRERDDHRGQHRQPV